MHPTSKMKHIDNSFMLGNLINIFVKKFIETNNVNIDIIVAIVITSKLGARAIATNIESIEKTKSTKIISKTIKKNNLYFSFLFDLFAFFIKIALSSFSQSENGKTI